MPIESIRIPAETLFVGSMSTSNKPGLRLGYAEYALFPNDGNRHEIVNGDHYIKPVPSTYHQTIFKRLQYFLYTQLELSGLGTVFNAPIDPQLSPHDVVQSDLVVEILSPSTVENDMQLKRQLYERSGMREYWIIDPFEHRIVQLCLTESKYIEQAAPETEIRFLAQPQVVIPLDQVW